MDRTFKVELFSGSYGDGVTNIERFNVLSPKDIICDRISTAKRLAELSNEAVAIRTKKYIPCDLPSGVGIRVSAFVGRARLITQYQSSRKPEFCADCSFARCRRRLMCLSIPTATTAELLPNPAVEGTDVDPQADSDSSDDDDTDDVDVSQNYWAMASPRSISRPQRVRFCTLACSLAFEAEVTAALPIRLSEIDSHESFKDATGKVGLTRVLASTRAAFKRNAAVARAIREAMRVHKKMELPSISYITVQKMHQNVIDALNVDLGLLFAAATLAVSPNICANRTLPATAPNWRQNPEKWSRVLERVKSLYLQHTDGKFEMCQDERFLPVWLKKVRSEAENIISAQV
jgi:hypothetical protein